MTDSNTDATLKSTSVRLREDQIEWFKENNISVSSVCREQLDEFIQARKDDWD